MILCAINWLGRPGFWIEEFLSSVIFYDPSALHTLIKRLENNQIKMTKRHHLQYLDGPSTHLEHGMSPVAYDSHREVYTYRDAKGNEYESQPGNQYGPLRLVSKARSDPARKNIMWDDDTHPEDEKKSGGGGRSRSKTVSKDSKYGQHRRGKSEEGGTPPPAYPGGRRFTNFDMLDPKKVTSQDKEDRKDTQSITSSVAESAGGVLGMLGRAISVRKGGSPPATRVGGTVGKSGRPRRRATVSGSAAGRYESS